MDVVAVKKTTKPAPKNPFYAQGLRFECTACGKCCSNHSGYDFVFLTPQDIRKMAKHLELKKNDFIKQFTRPEVADVVLQDKGDACIFLGKNGKCGVYQARPLQCRTFPFWPENMNAKTWEGELKRDCPGIGQGEPVPAKSIKNFLSWQEKAKYPKPKK